MKAKELTREQEATLRRVVAANCFWAIDRCLKIPEVVELREFTTQTKIREVIREIKEIRQKRQESRRTNLSLPFKARLKKHLLNKGIAEIRRRRLSQIAIIPLEALSCSDIKGKERVWVLHWSGVIEYSRKEQWKGRVSYLCGHSDGHDWAVRIPGTIDDCDSALDWLVPAVVKKAEKVVRQGDIYFIPSKRADMTAIEGSRHQVSEFKYGFRVDHPDHPTIKLKGHGWKAVRQTQMASHGSRINAD
jgi:hypothetical protein